MSYMLDRYSISEMVHFRGNTKLIEYAAGFIPVTFSWFIYSLGQLLFFWSILHVVQRKKRK
jgi:hypothetical protein